MFKKEKGTSTEHRVKQKRTFQLLRKTLPDLLRQVKKYYCNSSGFNQRIEVKDAIQVELSMMADFLWNICLFAAGTGHMSLDEASCGVLREFKDIFFKLDGLIHFELISTQRSRSSPAGVRPLNRLSISLKKDINLYDLKKLYRALGEDGEFFTQYTDECNHNDTISRQLSRVRDLVKYMIEMPQLAQENTAQRTELQRLAHKNRQLTQSFENAYQQAIDIADQKDEVKKSIVMSAEEKLYQLNNLDPQDVIDKKTVPLDGKVKFFKCDQRHQPCLEKTTTQKLEHPFMDITSLLFIFCLSAGGGHLMGQTSSSRLKGGLEFF